MVVRKRNWLGARELASEGEPAKLLNYAVQEFSVELCLEDLVPFRLLAC